MYLEKGSHHNKPEIMPRANYGILGNHSMPQDFVVKLIGEDDKRAHQQCHHTCFWLMEKPMAYIIFAQVLYWSALSTPKPLVEILLCILPRRSCCCILARNKTSHFVDCCLVPVSYVQMSIHRCINVCLHVIMSWLLWAHLEVVDSLSIDAASQMHAVYASTLRQNSVVTAAAQLLYSWTKRSVKKEFDHMSHNLSFVPTWSCCCWLYQ